MSIDFTPMSVRWMGAGSRASDCFQSYASQSPAWFQTISGQGRGRAEGGQFQTLLYQLRIDLVSIALQLPAGVPKRQQALGRL